MPEAARKGDSLLHENTALNGAACATVKIGGSMAWRVGDFHTCKVKNIPPTGGPPSIPHIGGSVLKGSFTVHIGGMPAARKGDIVVEPAAMPPTTPWLPKNDIQSGESSVIIGDVAFGIMDPAIMRLFCAEWRKLLRDWDGITDPDERRRRMEEVVNNALKRAGVPPVDGIMSTAPASSSAAFNQSTNSAGFANTICVPRGTFSGAAPAFQLGGILFHEARHVSQFFANARYLAGQRWNAAQIGRTGMDPGVIRSAIKNPAAGNSVAGQFGAMNHQQNYGTGPAGRDYNNQARAYQAQMHQAHGADSAAHGRAVEAYYTLPNEMDAQDAEMALNAICPEP